GPGHDRGGGDGPGLVPHLPPGRAGPRRPDRLLPRPHRAGQGAGAAAADPRPRGPPRHPRGPRRRRRPRAHRPALLLRGRRVRAGLRRPRLPPLLRRQRDLQERREPARRARGGGAGAGDGRDRRTLPDPRALPRAPELLVPDPRDHADHRRGHRNDSRAGLPRSAGDDPTSLRLAGRGTRMSAECSWTQSSGMLLSARDVRELAEAAGIRPSKQRGQNFVMDPNTVRTIVSRAGIAPGQAVLEIGPGLGSLTLGLLEARAAVIAVELDRGLAELLPLTLRARGVAEERFRLVHADALQVAELPTLPQAGEPTALVANLPYNVATPILLTMLERFASLRSALVMVQSEVVDRLTAGPGSRTYGAPSVKTAWYGRAVQAGRISRQIFWPVPNVDSALVELVRHERPLGTDEERREVFAVVDAAFAQRRKTLRAALAGWAGTATRSEQILREAGIAPGARGETLGIEEFRAIAGAARTIT